jgi:ArsR family transcriptional regulator
MANIKQIVKKGYKEIATKGSGCCCSNKSISQSIGYSEEELKIAGEANLGLGCGNPVALSQIKAGNTVLDLGSGAGIDCFLAAKKVGEAGKVIGVDMTEEMVARARENVKKQGINNIEFVLGDIENLPIKDSSIDVIISNCVINLAPDKDKTFKEAYRVLKPAGRMYVSDIVLLEELSKKQRTNEKLICGCVAGALLKDDYLEKARRAGFKVRILSENKAISKIQYQGINLESLGIEATK